MSGQPPTVGTGERASPGSVIDATSSELQQGHHVEIEPSNMGTPLNDSDPGLARSHAEGQFHETLAATLPSHNISQRRNGSHYETSPYGQEHNVQVSHESAIEHPTPFLRRGNLRVDRETLDYLRLKGAFTLPAQDVCRTLVQTYFHHVHPTFPAINAKDFLDEFVGNGVQNISLLLLWSMFSTATSVR